MLQIEEQAGWSFLVGKWPHGVLEEQRRPVWPEQEMEEQQASG